MAYTMLSFLGCQMIKDQNEYPAKTQVFSDGKILGPMTLHLAVKSSKEHGKSAFSTNHCSHSDEHVPTEEGAQGGGQHTHHTYSLSAQSRLVKIQPCESCLGRKSTGQA